MSGLGLLQEQMEALVRESHRIDLRTFETLPVERSRLALVPEVAALVRAARALVGRVQRACEEAGACEPEPLKERAVALDFERALDAAVAGTGVRAVEDIVFLVQLELRQREERLAQLSEATSTLTVIAECDSALRRVRKGLAAIDLQLARAEGAPPRLDFSSELRESLQVRRALARFRVRLLALTGSPSNGLLYSRMRAAGTLIAVFVGWDAYPLLRVRDRLQLRELQARILEWLRPERREDLLAGTRLWQDVLGFVEMLSQVNRREELLDHDGRLLAELLAELRRSDARQLDAPLEPRLRERARALEGLDEELDHLLSESEVRAADLGAALERVAARPGRGSPA